MSASETNAELDQLKELNSELLEALQILLGCVLMGGDPREGKGLRYPGTSPVSKARAAINKAKGGSVS